jgi:hypothetical protein
MVSTVYQKIDHNSNTDEELSSMLLNVEGSGGFAPMLDFRHSRRPTTRVVVKNYLNQSKNEKYIAADCALYEHSHRKISKIIYDEFSKEVLENDWHSVIADIVTKAVEQVRPSTKLLDDSMNINDYVKVKCIEHENIFLTKYIQGHVMTYPEWKG